MRYGILAGLTAGLVMTLSMIVLRILLNTVSVPEVLAERFVAIVPASFFSEVLGLLESFAKLVLIVGFLIAQVFVGGAFGVVYTRILVPVRLDLLPPWTGGVIFSLALWLFTMTLVIPIAGGGVFGGSLAGSQVSFLVTSLLPYLLYGWFLSTAFDDLYNRTTSEKAVEGRRNFLKWSIVGLFAMLLGAFGVRLLSQGGTITSARGIASGEMPLQVTPNDDFYIVSKNFIDPEVSEDYWSLKIGGLVEQPYSLSYEELTSLPWVDEYITLECISNKVGGNLISNARWRGVLLKDLLDRAKLKAGVVT